MISGWNYITPIEKLIEEVGRVLVPCSSFYVIQFHNNRAWEPKAVRNDGIPEIMETFRRLGYFPETENICRFVDVVYVEKTEKPII